jgi:excisionase family DNA binding protein
MERKRNQAEKIRVPVWYKANLSIEEATAYSGIGRDKLYEMTDREDCPFVLWIGSRRLIKREVFDEYIKKAYSI